MSKIVKFRASAKELADISKHIGTGNRSAFIKRCIRETIIRDNLREKIAKMRAEAEQAITDGKFWIVE